MHNVKEQNSSGTCRNGRRSGGLNYSNNGRFLPWCIFQEDNSRIPGAQIVKECFKDDETSLSHMDQPPESPRTPTENQRADPNATVNRNKSQEIVESHANIESDLN